MSKIRLQAHRGVSSEYPENTFAAFQAAIDEGYDIIELDPKYTADNHIVILHDRTVNRTGRRQDGSTLPPDTAIKDLTFAQARELEYGSWKDPKFKGEKIPSLEELIDFIKAHNIPFKFDNVWETFPPEQQEIFLSQLEKANLGSKIGFTCRKPECFALVAKRFPQAELHWDGANDKATLEDVVKVAAGHRLTIWVCYDNKLTGWFKGAKATQELCDMVHQFGEIGIWILSQEAELDDTVNVFKANAIETTGHIKPAMLA